MSPVTRCLGICVRRVPMSPVGLGTQPLTSPGRGHQFPSCFSHKRCPFFSLYSCLIPTPKTFWDWKLPKAWSRGHPDLACHWVTGGKGQQPLPRLGSSLGFALPQTQNPIYKIAGFSFECCFLVEPKQGHLWSLWLPRSLTPCLVPLAPFPWDTAASQAGDTPASWSRDTPASRVTQQGRRAEVWVGQRCCPVPPTSYCKFSTLSFHKIRLITSTAGSYCESRDGHLGSKGGGLAHSRHLINGAFRRQCRAWGRLPPPVSTSDAPAAGCSEPDLSSPPTGARHAPPLVLYLLNTAAGSLPCSPCTQGPGAQSVCV